MSKLLKGKCALVTGASSGVGLGIAKVFAREGANLVVTYRKNREGIDRLLEAVQPHDVKITAMQVDISHVEEIEPLIDAAVRELGRLDIVVNNAGTSERCPFLEVTPDMFERVYSTNARGTFFCAQAAAKVMIQQKSGKIINVSTFQTSNITENSSVYVSTKGAIDRMTAGMAFELSPHNIQVNTISPGWIPTESDAPMSDEESAEYRKYIPYGRFGTAEDIGETAAFMASDRCAFMTGARIVVDGGQSVPLYFPPRSMGELQ
jgi:3-oxoacyl-[acyl-carrier protein] reductase